MQACFMVGGSRFVLGSRACANLHGRNRGLG